MNRSRTAHDQLGTLVWIGDPTVPEFQDAFQFCTSHAAQLAVRSDLAEALRRPAGGVRRILLARPTREAVDPRSLDRLAELYPQASMLNLLGTLCEGMTITSEPTCGVNRLYWHRWNQVLPEWLAPCGAIDDSLDPSVDAGIRSVAVLASTYVIGEPLLDLAESAGVTAIWCKTADTRVRNLDAVWWDDSVAPPVTRRRWRERIAPFGSCDRTPQHAWIVNSPRYDQHRQATDGGIDLVVSKPHRIECLLGTLKRRDVNQHRDRSLPIGLKAA